MADEHFLFFRIVVAIQLKSTTKTREHVPKNIKFQYKFEGKKEKKNYLLLS